MKRYRVMNGGAPTPPPPPPPPKPVPPPAESASTLKEPKSEEVNQRNKRGKSALVIERKAPVAGLKKDPRGSGGLRI